MNDQLEPDWDPRAEKVLRDPSAAYDEMRERCPVAYSDYLQWSLFRHEDITRVLNDHHTFSNVVSRHLSVPNGMDPPEHTAYRRLIESYFFSRTDGSVRIHLPGNRRRSGSERPRCRPGGTDGRGCPALCGACPMRLSGLATDSSRPHGALDPEKHEAHGLRTARPCLKSRASSSASSIACLKVAFRLSKARGRHHRRADARKKWGDSS